ncbi:MAG TPA: hypothetical protein VJ974_02780 [Geopsychrobacteraceae bacterium]|nr:hypothetical protein [Geopsychrobacteraceae bacterium]
MSRITMVMILLCLSVPSYAERFFTEVSGSRDSDDASSLMLFTGYRQALDGPGVELEFAGGQRIYTEAGEREKFDSGRLLLLSTPGRNWNTILRIEFLGGDDWSPTLPAAFFSNQFNKNWYAEVSAEREPVDSVSAIRNHIRVDSYVASADYRLNNKVTLVGALISQHFSDDNQKRGGIGRIIISPAQLPGFHLQLKGRSLQADQDSPDYFSPRNLSEGLLLFGYAKAFLNDNWVIKLLGGPGLQRVEPFDDEANNKAVYQAEIHMRGWFNDHVQLTSRLGCTSANDTREAYSYCFGKMHLGYAW